MRPIRTVRAGLSAPFASLGNLLSSHQALTRVAVAAIVFTVVIAFSQQTSTQAGPEMSRPVPQSLLPVSVGVGIGSDDAVLVTFDEPMDPTSVEAALQLMPAEPVAMSWNADRTALSIEPDRRWQTDEVYLVVINESATTDAGAAVPVQRFAFSTQTAPVVTDFQVTLADAGPQAEDSQVAARAIGVEQEPVAEGTLTPRATAREVSAGSSIQIGFSARMDRADVESRFTITPEVEGDLTWAGRDLVFTPTERLELGGRYTISLASAHDRLGNTLGGKANLSFVVREAPQLLRTTPEGSATDTEPATVEMWFSHPMDVDATNTAFGLTDTTTGALVAGRLNWNEDGTQIVYVPDSPLAGGRTYEVGLGSGAVDADGNPISVEWSFTTKAAPVVAPPPPPPAAPAAPQRAAVAAAPPPPPPPPPAPAPVAVGASGLEGYALAQINSARAAYGFPPLALDGTLSAMATAHAWDQINNGYYAHAGRPGGYAAWGENQCHHYAMRAEATLNWCHGVFMSEPWPGYWNHIGNILSTRYTRVGIGIADSGSRVVITWDFAN